MATSCENMALHRERVTEKSQKFQIVYAGRGPTNLCQDCTTDPKRSIMPNECNQSVLSQSDLSNNLKLQAAFLYSNYHQ